MATTLVTTTWNSLDHLEIFLDHYRKLGVRVLAMDFDSTDGTAEVLVLARVGGSRRAGSASRHRWSRFVNEMLAIAQSSASADDWCLFCDPDELLVTPSMRIAEVIPAGEAAGVDCSRCRAST
ncbi:MAG: glycosyltransferase family 2 protein [Actinomycetes bacterium]